MTVSADPRGHLVLVVGPSGAGKDTLIALARAALPNDADVVFPRRIVTRAASSFEDNRSVSATEFAAGEARGDHVLSWQAHGLSYALSRDIDDDLRDGRTLVVNVSRQVVETARSRYAARGINVSVVLVTAPPEVLAARLAERGRTSDGPLRERLERIGVAIVPDVTIHNVGRAEDHARELLDVIDH